MTQRRSGRWRSASAALPVAAVVALAGCSDGGAPSDETGGEEVEFTFTYSTSNNLDSPWEQLAERYMEVNPEVAVTVNPQPNDQYAQSLRTQLQAGNAADLLQTAPGSGQGHGIVSLAEAGFLEPLDEASTGLVPSGSEALFVVDDELYGQPTDITVTGVGFSLTTAKSIGVDAFPETTEDLLALCDEVASQGKALFSVAGAAGPNTGMMAMVISSTRVYAEDPDWNTKRIEGEVTFADSEGWRETLDTIVALNEAECFQPGAEGAGFDAVTNGLAGGSSLSAFLPGSAATEIKTVAPDQEIFIQGFPPTEGGTPFGMASSNYSLSINAASTKKEAVQEFLDWLAEPGQAGLFADLSGGLPVTGVSELDLTGTIYEPLVEILDAGDYAPLPNSLWPNQSVFDELAGGVQGLLTGQQTTEEVLAEMDSAWSS